MKLYEAYWLVGILGERAKRKTNVSLESSLFTFLSLKDKECIYFFIFLVFMLYSFYLIYLSFQRYIRLKSFITQTCILFFSDKTRKSKFPTLNDAYRFPPWLLVALKPLKSLQEKLSQFNLFLYSLKNERARSSFVHTTLFSWCI